MHSYTWDCAKPKLKDAQRALRSLRALESLRWFQPKAPSGDPKVLVVVLLFSFEIQLKAAVIEVQEIRIARSAWSYHVDNHCTWKACGGGGGFALL